MFHGYDTRSTLDLFIKSHNTKLFEEYRLQRHAYL
jgi:hypothetical protein